MWFFYSFDSEYLLWRNMSLTFTKCKCICIVIDGNGVGQGVSNWAVMTTVMNFLIWNMEFICGVLKIACASQKLPSSGLTIIWKAVKISYFTQGISWSSDNYRLFKKECFYIITGTILISGITRLTICCFSLILGFCNDGFQLHRLRSAEL